MAQAVFVFPTPPDGMTMINGKQELVWPKEFATAAFAYPAPPFAQR